MAAPDPPPRGGRFAPSPRLGRDLADYSYVTSGITVDLILTHWNTGDAVGDTYTGMDGVLGSTHDDILRGAYAADTLVGNGGDDFMEGREGNDWLRGGGGDDTLRGGRGADNLDGGAGFDIVDYGQASEGVTVDLVQPWANTGEAAGDIFTGIWGLNGSQHDDVIHGSWIGKCSRAGTAMTKSSRAQVTTHLRADWATTF